MCLVLCAVTSSGVFGQKSDQLQGTYNLDRAENFSSYLGALGVDFITRTLAGLARPEVTISRKCRDEQDLKVVLEIRAFCDRRLEYGGGSARSR